jgi:hypothetical protein
MEQLPKQKLTVHFNGHAVATMDVINSVAEVARGLVEQALRNGAKLAKQGKLHVLLDVRWFWGSCRCNRIHDKLLRRGRYAYFQAR